MNELSGLRKTKRIYRSLKENAENPESFKQEFFCFLNAAHLVFLSAKTEAQETPAGERWFKGQLKIHPALKFFSESEISKSELELKNTENQETKYFLQDEKGLHEISDLVDNYLKELEKFINSGLNRYISG